MDSPNDSQSNRIKAGDFVIAKKLHDKTFGRLVKVDPDR